MIQEARSIARECQSLWRNISTTTLMMRPVPRLLRLTLTRLSQDQGEWMLRYPNVEMKISNGVFVERNVNFPRLKTPQDSLHRRQWIIIITTHRLRRQKAFAETLVISRVILVWWHLAIWLIRSRLEPRRVRIVRRDSVLIGRGCRLMRLWRLGVALAAWGWSNRNRSYCNSNKRNVLLVIMIVSFHKNRLVLDSIIRKKRFYFSSLRRVRHRFDFSSRTTLGLLFSPFIFGLLFCKCLVWKKC